LKAKGRNEPAEHKKKTMKTTSNKSLKAQGQTEPSSTANSASTTKAPLPRIRFKERRLNRSLTTKSVLHLLRIKAPKFWELAEVVGQWVWITFTEKQPREVTAALSELGFHWNNLRQCWQHPCGTWIERTPRDPREKYGSYFAADLEII
jgi:hypothetical protein